MTEVFEVAGAQCRAPVPRIQDDVHRFEAAEQCFDAASVFMRPTRDGAPVQFS